MKIQQKDFDALLEISKEQNETIPFIYRKKFAITAKEILGGLSTEEYWKLAGGYPYVEYL